MLSKLDPDYSKKESVNEGVSQSQAQEIMKQLGGRKFEMLMGVKSKGIGKDGLDGGWSPGKNGGVSSDTNGDDVGGKK